MAYTYDPQIEHLLRRAGFGARPDELQTFHSESFPGAVDRLVNYERISDDVDQHIGQPGYLQTPPQSRAGALTPSININDARMYWLFRMVHTNRPLQEKMALFWHNHFATAYSKVAGVAGADLGANYMAAQIQMFRDNALGNFRDLLVKVARDTAMLYWLDGYLNQRGRPQENFGRELMELFTLGVGDVGKPNYVEADVYAAARVFTGWNLNRAAVPAVYAFNQAQHDPTEKTFTFAVQSNGSKTIPARAGAMGEQDGLDLINALAAHPATGPYLAGKLYRFFVSEVGDVDPAFVSRVSGAYYSSGYEMKAVMREVLLSPQFWNRDNYFTRYSWPVEFMVRALKDIGWSGFNAATALTPLANMGQALFEPPDVAGWDLGPRWFSTGAMLARMNFASALALNQRSNMRNQVLPIAKTPDAVLSFVLGALKTPNLDRSVTDELSAYLIATGPWTGSSAQVDLKVAGLVHLVASTPEYQFV